MNKFLRSFLAIALLCVAASDDKPKGAPAGHGPNATLDPAALQEFVEQPERVQKLLRSALDWAGKNVTYTYGSALPASGGVDCSGFIYYILREQGFEDVPRQANQQYVWLRKKNTFRAVLSSDPKTFELDELKPGDLLFWSGTYKIDRDPPITHTMIYLGTEIRRKQRVMIGASNGRSYDGKPRWGISVFDFKAGLMPRLSDSEAALRPSFLGYARIPGLRDD